jgi:hypothetical protein
MSLKKTNSGGYQSEAVKTVFYDLPMAAGNMSYDWVVPNVTVSTGE